MGGIGGGGTIYVRLGRRQIVHQTGLGFLCPGGILLRRSLGLPAGGDGQT